VHGPLPRSLFNRSLGSGGTHARPVLVRTGRTDADHCDGEDDHGFAHTSHIGCAMRPLKSPRVSGLAIAQIVMAATDLSERKAWHH
jgi:hypothetical protein